MVINYFFNKLRIIFTIITFVTFSAELRIFHPTFCVSLRQTILLSIAINIGMTSPPKFTRRKLDLEATLAAYTNRLLSIRPEIFESLNGCWLSSYDLWDSYTREQLIESELDLRRFTNLDNNVLVLFHVCVQLGINVLGIASDR